jgi:hypothetical protein
MESEKEENKDTVLKKNINKEVNITEYNDAGYKNTCKDNLVASDDLRGSSNADYEYKNEQKNIIASDAEYESDAEYNSDASYNSDMIHKEDLDSKDGSDSD